MKRHRLDLVNLLFGLALAMFAVAFIVGQAADVDVNPAWVVAGGFVTLGVVALAATLSSSGSSGEIDPSD